MGLNARIDLNIGATLTSAFDLTSQGRIPLSVAKAFVLSTGVGAGQANMLWFDTRTILASADDDLDLSGGLTDGFGQPAPFARVKAMYVYADPDNINDIRVGGGGVNSFSSWLGDDTDVVTLTPGGLLLLATADPVAYVVTPAIGDILRITNAAGGSSVVYDIVLFGTSS